MKALNKFIIVLAGLTLLASRPQPADAADLQIFNYTDYTKLIEQQHNRPFTMMFWSMDCAPCLKKMNQISKQSEDRRNDYIFISTDGDEMITEVTDTLKQMNLLQANNWIFNSAQTQQIISTVDTQWYGETPRSYFFDARQKRTRLK